jgi:hypothetical protein
VFFTGHFWADGWKAIHSIRRWRQEPLDADLERRLMAIEEFLAPSDLVDRTRAVVLQNAVGAFDDLGPDDDFTAHSDRMQAQAYELGRDVAQSEAAFKELLPERVTPESWMYLGHFMKGMICGSPDHRGQWNSILAQFIEAEPKRRSADCLAIFLFNLRDTNSELVEVLLDESMNEKSLVEWAPLLQCRAGMQLQGVERLKRSLANGIAPIESYRNLAYRFIRFHGCNGTPFGPDHRGTQKVETALRKHEKSALPARSIDARKVYIEIRAETDVPANARSATDLATAMQKPAVVLVLKPREVSVRSWTAANP